MKPEDNLNKKFPLLSCDGGGTIPWWLALEAYQHYSKKFGTSQSLERIAERGGFGHAELLLLLRREI